MPPPAGRTRPSAGRWALFGIVLALLALRIAGFVLLVVLIVSTALLVIWFGLSVLLGTLALLRGFTRIHRRPAGRVLGGTIAEPQPPEVARGMFDRLRARLTDRRGVAGGAGGAGPDAGPSGACAQPVRWSSPTPAGALGEQPGVGYLLNDRLSDVTQFVDAIRRVAAGAAIAAWMFISDKAVGKHTNWRARRTGDRCLGTSCRSARGSRRFTVLVSTSC